MDVVEKQLLAHIKTFMHAGRDQVTEDLWSDLRKYQNEKRDDGAKASI